MSHPYDAWMNHTGSCQLRQSYPDNHRGRRVHGYITLYAGGFVLVQDRPLVDTRRFDPITEPCHARMAGLYSRTILVRSSGGLGSKCYADLNQTPVLTRVGVAGAESAQTRSLRIEDCVAGSSGQIFQYS